MTRYVFVGDIWVEADSPEEAADYLYTALEQSDGKYGGPYVHTWDLNPPREDPPKKKPD